VGGKNPRSKGAVASGIVSLKIGSYEGFCWSPAVSEVFSDSITMNSSVSAHCDQFLLGIAGPRKEDLRALNPTWDELESQRSWGLTNSKGESSKYF
jgi:hypothetical protein